MLLHDKCYFSVEFLKKKSKKFIVYKKEYISIYIRYLTKNAFIQVFHFRLYQNLLQPLFGNNFDYFNGNN